MIQKPELTFQKSAAEIEKILAEEHGRHKPVEMATRRIWIGGTTTRRVTEATFKNMVVEAASLSPLK